MAALDLQEQEQLEALKAWWKDNGNWILGTVRRGRYGQLARLAVLPAPAGNQGGDFVYASRRAGGQQ